MLQFKQCVVKRAVELYSIEHIFLEKGQFVALIGANGVGKSTLFQQLISGELKGSVEFDSQSISTMSSKERAKIVALVDNKFLLTSQITAYDYLQLGRIPHTGFYGQLKNADFEIIDRLIEEFKISHLQGKWMHELSDGERQMVSIVRALVQDTPIILLDEPTAFLDYPRKKDFLQAFQTIAKEKNKLLIMSTHDLELAYHYCDSFLFVNSKEKVLQNITKPESSEVLITNAFPNT
ncbi:MAG: ABC transporter ATP-binding protein [Fluviicola sp.]